MNSSTMYMHTFFIRQNLSRALDISQELSYLGRAFESTDLSSSHYDKMLDLVDSFRDLIGSILGEKHSDKSCLDCRDFLPNNLAIDLYYVYEESIILKTLLYDLKMSYGTSITKQVQIRREVLNKVRLIKEVAMDFGDQSENIDTLLANDKALLN